MPGAAHKGTVSSEDEISLIDLWLVLARRKAAILGTVLLCVAIGLGLALTKKPEYAYRTTLEIGSVVAGANTRPIDSPQNALSKLQESYIPVVLNNYAQTHDQDDSSYKIKASVPKGSEIVVLEAQGSIIAGPIYLELLGEAVAALREDHRRIVASLKKSIEIQQNRVRNEMTALQDSRRILLSDKKRLDELTSLLKGQIEDTKRMLRAAEANRSTARGEAQNEPTAMTLLMLDNEIRETRRQLSQLEERLYVGIARKQDELVKALADNERKQAEASDQLSKLELDLANFRETRITVEPMRSLDPVDTSRPLIVVLSLLIGLIGGVFAAFFAEFHAKVRTAIRMAAVQPA